MMDYNTCEYILANYKRQLLYKIASVTQEQKAFKAEKGYESQDLEDKYAYYVDALTMLTAVEAEAILGDYEEADA